MEDKQNRDERTQHWVMNGRGERKRQNTGDKKKKWEGSRRDKRRSRERVDDVLGQSLDAEC